MRFSLLSEGSVSDASIVIGTLFLLPETYGKLLIAEASSCYVLEIKQREEKKMRNFLLPLWQLGDLENIVSIENGGNLVWSKYFDKASD